MAISEEFLRKTIEVWQPHYKERLTLADAEEIINTSYSLISYLAYLDKKYKGAFSPPQ